jgi:hypothetical protein
MSVIYKQKIEPTSSETTEVVQTPSQPQYEAQNAPQQPTEATDTGSVSEYLNAKEFMGDFKIRMDVGKIEKFIQAELEERGIEKTKANYHILLMDIENQINLKDKDLFTKIKKLAEYSDLMGKINKLNIRKNELLG